ncbi:MAG: glycosyltransferase family 2 protein [Nitrosomonadales bacterium]|nr:glycosyltransferase family 2 protein [Nitrosomonadales bacterium]
MFSIVIPSWNNLAYLKLCVESLKKHSRFEHEILVHLNDGSDGSLEWVKSQGIKYTQSARNVGVCLSVNHLVAQASHDWVLYMNDDMVAAPGWDTAFIEAIKSVDTGLALFFGTLIQPENGGNDIIIKQNFGETPSTFDEAKFLQQHLADSRGDKEGAASQPTLAHKKWWSMVGGYSLEFSPGMSSDDDLLIKFWVAGCRNFRIVGASRFYHFGCKSTGRIKHNLGGRIFVMKWGITQIEFHRLYLHSLRQANGGNTANNPHNCVRASWLGKLRRVGYALRYNYPLEDIEAWDPVPGRSEWNGENAE